MIAEKNVIDFNPERSRSSTDKFSPVVEECRTLFHKEFTPILSHFFDKLDDELFSLSDKAVSSTQQEMYFEAMRYIRRERENIERGYLAALLKGYDVFWQARTSKPKPSTSATHLDLNEEDFSLVENEILEVDLAVSTLINKGNNLYHRDLYAVNKRFAKLLGRPEIGSEENPVSPHGLGKTFADILQPLTLELKVKLVLFKLYEHHVIGELEIVYDTLNEALAKQGVLPEISRKVKKRSSREGSAKHGTDESRSQEDPISADQTTYVQAIQAMHTLLSAWRGEVGLPSLADSAQDPGVVVSETQEVVGALSSLQDPDHVVKLTEALQNGEGTNLKLVLAGHLSETQGGKRALAQMDEDIIDMIGMIFDFILEDRNLPTQVKVLIGRLQIPIVKVAVLDKSFFSKKNHPARVLLNQLAHAGIALSGDEDLEQNQTFQQIQTIVDRILNEFAQDVGLFDELLEQFSAFTEQEGKRSQRLEERTRQATQSKEHLLLAKKEVAGEIAQRMQDLTLPPRLKHIFTTTWRDFLLLSCLRKDKDPETWEGKIALTDTLLWTLTPPKNDSERKRILQRIPGLLRALRHELEGVSFDPKQIALFFKELESAHQSLVQNGESQVDPLLEKEMQAICANLPDVEELDVSDLTDIREEELEEEIILVTEELDDAEGDEFVINAQSMEVGDWVELTDSNGKSSRVKLSWVSKVTGIRVFVNRRGMKVAEYTLNGLAAELRRGTAKVIEGGKVPLMDRALSAMMSTLNHPAKQQNDQAVFDAAPALQ